jgi:short-subunit dehydrogenase
VLRVRGARLVLTSRNDAKIRAAASKDDLIVAGDLTRDATRVSVVEQAAGHFGRIDVLINNAGKGSYHSFSETPLDEARDLFELNFFAPLHLAQLAAPWLRKSNGTLVNVTSLAGEISLPWLPLYSASKFALASLSSTERMELRRQGVRVMTVFPGYVQTAFQDHASGPRPPASVVKGMRYAITPEQCAAAIVNGIERQKRVVVTPRSGWAAIWANRFFPGWLESRLELV